MRTTDEAARHYVDNSNLVCALFDALVHAELARLPGPLYNGPRPTSEALIAELRTLLKSYAEDIVSEYEGKLSEVRTTLKYEPEDVTL